MVNLNDPCKYGTAHFENPNSLHIFMFTFNNTNTALPNVFC